MAKNYYININFKTPIKLEECFEKLFLTIDYRRLNGCTFYRNSENDHKTSTIYMVCHDQVFLEEITKVLKSTKDFNAFLRDEAIGPSHFKNVNNPIKLGKIENYTINEDPAKSKYIGRGYRQTRNKEKFTTEYNFETIPCRKCKEDTMGISFCPECGAQNKNMDVFALLILGGVLLYNIFISFTSIKSTWNHSLGGERLIYIMIAVVRTLGYPAGVGLIYFYRKPGFYILALTKILDGALRILLYDLTNPLGMVVETLVTILFIYVAKLLLDGDMVFMKKGFK